MIRTVFFMYAQFFINSTKQACINNFKIDVPAFNTLYKIEWQVKADTVIYSLQ